MAPQGILLLFVDFDSEFPQALLLHIFQVLQDVFKVLLCTVSQLHTNTKWERKQSDEREIADFNSLSVAWLFFGKKK